VVTAASGRVSYSPPAVRALTLRVDHSGLRTVTTQTPCPERVVRTRCTRRQQTLRGGTARFFRSARNELSFAPAALPFPASACPGESADVRAIRPGLHDAQGAVSETALANPRFGSQTALGSSVQTTDLEGDETGRVTERVHWGL